MSHQSNRGFTLVETIIAIVLSLVAIFGIETLIVQAYKDWRESQAIVALERDFDTASYRIKGILEEADDDTVLVPGPITGTRIQASYGSLWQKEVYDGGNSKLILKNNKTGSTEEVIGTLKSISFQQISNHSLKVNLSVENNQDQLDSGFIVYLRNRDTG